MFKKQFPSYICSIRTINIYNDHGNPLRLEKTSSSWYNCCTVSRDYSQSYMHGYTYIHHKTINIWFTKYIYFTYIHPMPQKETLYINIIHFKRAFGSQIYKRKVGSSEWENCWLLKHGRIMVKMVHLPLLTVSCHLNGCYGAAFKKKWYFLVVGAVAVCFHFMQKPSKRVKIQWNLLICVLYPVLGWVFGWLRLCTLTWPNWGWGGGGGENFTFQSVQLFFRIRGF